MCFGLFIAAGSFFLGPSNRPLRLLSAVVLGQHLPAGSIQYDVVFNSHRTPTNYADFLAGPNALQERVRSVDTTRTSIEATAETRIPKYFKP
jgi:hypothetical protein